MSSMVAIINSPCLIHSVCVSGRSASKARRRDNSKVLLASADGKKLYVSANNSHRILVFSSEDDLLRAWGGEGEEPGMFRYPATIGLDPARATPLT